MDPDFVDEITHKMKVTLTYVHGYANMLPLAGEINDEQTRYVKKILKGVDQLTKLVNEVTARAEMDPSGDETRS